MNNCVITVITLGLTMLGCGGGREAESDDFFAVGLVHVDGNPTCTGTLVAPQTVLTAARCIPGGPLARVEVLFHERSPLRVAHIVPYEAPSDLAILFLEASPPAVAPLPLAPSRRRLVSARPSYALVGFGTRAGCDTDKIFPEYPAPLGARVLYLQGSSLAITGYHALGPSAGLGDSGAPLVDLHARRVVSIVRHLQPFEDAGTVEYTTDIFADTVPLARTRQLLGGI